MFFENRCENRCEISSKAFNKFTTKIKTNQKYILFIFYLNPLIIKTDAKKSKQIKGVNKK